MYGPSHIKTNPIIIVDDILYLLSNLINYCWRVCSICFVDEVIVDVGPPNLVIENMKQFFLGSNYCFLCPFDYIP